MLIFQCRTSLIAGPTYQSLDCLEAYLQNLSNRLPSGQWSHYIVGTSEFGFTIYSSTSSTFVTCTNSFISLQTINLYRLIGLLFPDVISAKLASFKNSSFGLKLDIARGRTDPDYSVLNSRGKCHTNILANFETVPSLFSSVNDNNLTSMHI